MPENVVAEFEETLARQRAKHRDRPLRELTALLLLAMEREQIVSIAYRDELIQGRLDTLPLADDVRDILRQGVAWAWKDEEMHAIYTRGLLLRIGGPWTRARTLMAQLAGAVGGWASSVQQHARWSQAPAARTLAAAITGIGRAVGKVPHAVRDRLRFLSFREFCELHTGWRGTWPSRSRAPFSSSRKSIPETAAGAPVRARAAARTRYLTSGRPTALRIFAICPA